MKSTCSVLFLNLYLLKYMYNLTCPRNSRSFALVLLKGSGTFILISFLTSVCSSGLMTSGIRVSILDSVGHDPDIMTYSNRYHSGIVLKV